MEELASAGRAALVASQRGGDFGSGALGHPGPCKQYGRIIVWFRRDLRLTDNPALLAASLLAEEVVCVYVYAPEEDGQFQPGRCSRWWLKSALSSLRRELWERCETQLLFFRAPDSGRLLASLVEDMKADGVFFNHLYDPISMVRDNEVKTLLRRNEVVCQSFNCDTLREPWSVVDADSNAYASFESFWKAHQDEERLGRVAKPAPMVGRLCDGSGGGVGGLGKAAKSDAPAGVCLGLQSSLSLTGEWHCATLEDVGILSRQEAASNVQLEVHWKPGRAGGMKMLQSFVDDKLGSFSYDKAKTDRKSTSRLSPYLHYGEIGIREVLAVVETWEASASQSGKKSHAHATAFRKQLGYREYARYLSFHFQGVAHGQHGVSHRGRGNAGDMVDRLDAQPLPCRVRVLPRQVSVAAVAVGSQTFLGRVAGRRSRVRRARLAVLRGMPDRWTRVLHGHGPGARSREV
jgi:cryptochrome 1